MRLAGRAGLRAAAVPLEDLDRRLTVVVGRDGGDLARTRRLGGARFEHVVRRVIGKRGGQKRCLRIIDKLFAALTDPAGVIAHRAGALERVQLLLQDWQHAHRASPTPRPA